MELTKKEGMVELIKAIKKLEPPKGNSRTLSFIMKSQDQDLLVHITIPPPHIDIGDVDSKILSDEGGHTWKSHGGYYKSLDYHRPQTTILTPRQGCVKDYNTRKE